MKSYFLSFFLLTTVISSHVCYSQEDGFVLDWQRAPEASFAGGGATMRLIAQSADDLVKIRVVLNDENLVLHKIDPGKLFIKGQYSFSTSCVRGGKNEQICMYSFMGKVIDTEQFSSKTVLFVDTIDKSGRKVREEVRPWFPVEVYPVSFDFSQNNNLSLKNVYAVSAKQIEGFVLGGEKYSCEDGENSYVVDMGDCDRLRPNAVCSIDLFGQNAGLYEQSRTFCLKFNLNGEDRKQSIILHNTKIDSIAAQVIDVSHDEAVGDDSVASDEEIGGEQSVEKETHRNDDFAKDGSHNESIVDEVMKDYAVAGDKEISGEQNVEKEIHRNNEFAKNIVSGITVATVIGVTILCRAKCCGVR